MKSKTSLSGQRITEGVGAVSRRVDALVQLLAFCSLLAMLVVITMQIVFRVYFRALPWSEELSRYLLVWTTFLGATMAYRRGAHIAVTFLVDSLPFLLRRLVRIGAILASLFFFCVAMWYAVLYMQVQSFQVTASLRLPMPYVYAVMPASFAVMILHGLHALLLEVFQDAGTGTERNSIHHPASPPGPAGPASPTSSANSETTNAARPSSLDDSGERKN